MYPKTTPRTRQATPVVLASDDDLSRDVLMDHLAHIEPLTLDDLLDLADMVGGVEAGEIVLQTAVTQ